MLIGACNPMLCRIHVVFLSFPSSRLLDMGAWCSKPIDEIKDRLCYGKKATSMGYGLEHIVPYALALCPDR